MIGGEVVMQDRRFLRVDREAAVKELADQMAAPMKPDELRRREMS